MLGSARVFASAWLLFLLPPGPALADIPRGQTAPLTETPSRALLTVRTLVIDALGTRTVDTNVAHVPFGGTGLLIRQVPYAGPALSFRLAVTAGPPQETGIPLTIGADIWNGEASAAPPEGRTSHREEATVISTEGSYLFEIDHDEGTDRRIVLSLTARVAGDRDVIPPPPVRPAGAVRFDVTVHRQSGGQTDPPDSQVLETLVGLPVSYSSGVKVRGPAPGGDTRFVGLSVTLTPERASGELLTVRVEISGADFVDVTRTRLEPFGVVESRTVSSGTGFELIVAVPDDRGEGLTGLRPVTYRIGVVPTLSVQSEKPVAPR